MSRNSSAPQERAAAIEILLLWEGRVSRARLVALFGSHPTVASRDLAAFRRERKDSLAYDTVEQAYVATPMLRPTLTGGDFSDYVRLVSAAPAANVCAGVPFDTARVDATRIGYPLFARLHAAVREQRPLEISYRSMRDPAPHNRTILPHAFVQAGPRWHVRAYSVEHGQFRDFNLARIVSVASVDVAGLPSAAEDAAWNTRVDLRLVPHRALDAEQQRLVRDEYLSGTQALVLSVRAAMVKYIVDAYRAAFDPSAEQPPAHPLMVSSAEALPAIAKRWLSDSPDK